MTDQGENNKNGRETLKTLQFTATDDNLVGRSKISKHQLSQDTSGEIEVKRKNLSNKETQVNFNEITVDDLTNPDGPSERYWQILAEKQQIALQEALEKNGKLRNIIEELIEENTRYKKLLEEANSFVEVFKEITSDKDDTGIDVNDISTADEGTENDETKESIDTELNSKSSNKKD